MSAREVLDEETWAYIDRLVDVAPPFSKSQERVITAAFAAEDEIAEAGDA